MSFDLQWLLWAFPLAFALGWLASRFDLRQWKRESQDSPRAYFKGLNLLLNEQQDKAIDAFIEAVQHDPGSSDLHFALGNLFRRRGEYERAVRVHQHLLGRADLAADERARAQHALAQDFMKAGLFDRAESAYRALEGTVFATEARLALLTLHERSRDWLAAVEVARGLENTGAGSFAQRMAHYWCELALEADAAGQTAEADRCVQRAREVAPQALRPIALAGQRLARAGQHEQALATWAPLMAVNPAGFAVLAADHANSAIACGRQAEARERLGELLAAVPTMDVLNAVLKLEPDADRRRALLREHLARVPSLTAAQALLREQHPETGTAASAPDVQADTQAVAQAVAVAQRPLQRYRCAACGFEAQHYFWQCPGCHGWDTFPPRRLEDL